MNYKLWIDGNWEDTRGGRVMSIEDPTTGREIAEVIDASREDVDRAVQAARRAFYDGRWSKKSPGIPSLEREIRERACSYPSQVPAVADR